MLKNQANYYYFKKILADRQIFCMTYQCSILPHNRYKILADRQIFCMTYQCSILPHNRYKKFF